MWLTHAGFALPFAIFLLHNYISGLPKDLFEAARIDGADHFTIFWRLVLPLSVPVLAAFAIFQFLWTWNDYLIANTMIGSNPDAIPTTIRIANLAGDFGRNEHILPPAAFVQAFVPIIVFFALQRYFVRGILAGSRQGLTRRRRVARRRRRRAGSAALGAGRADRATASGATRPTTSAPPRRCIEAALDAGHEPGRHRRRVRPRLGRHRRSVRSRSCSAGCSPRRRSCATAWCWRRRAASGRRSPYDSSPAGAARRRARRRCGACSVDVIDLYQIHRPDMFTHPADVAATLAALRDEGKIREVGVSNHTPAQVDALQAHLPFPLVSNQPEYSAAHLDPLRDGTFDACMRDGITPLAWSPLAGGRAGDRRGRAARAAGRARRARRARGRRPRPRRAGVRAGPPVAHRWRSSARRRPGADRAVAATAARPSTSIAPTSYRIVQASRGRPAALTSSVRVTAQVPGDLCGAQSS